MTDAPLSVVVVARDEARRLPALLADLAAGSGGLVRELVVVDGASRDGTARLARLAGARVVSERPCRGRQLASGVDVTSGPWLLLLHGDGRLPPRWPELLAERIAAPVAPNPEAAGAWAFRLAIEGADPALRLVEAAVTLRSRWRQRPYGDQGLLLPRHLYEACGGMAPLPLMEDLDFVIRLARLTRIGCLDAALTVNGARWRRLGVWRTTLANARLRQAWRRGVAVERLAELYAGPAQGEYQKAQRR